MEKDRQPMIGNSTSGIILSNMTLQEISIIGLDPKRLFHRLNSPLMSDISKLPVTGMPDMKECLLFFIQRMGICQD
jgi:hypothetical protein